MKVLVIGYGSIGKRHARILAELGHKVAVLSNYNAAENYVQYFQLEEALNDWNPKYIVIANQTIDHYQSCQALADLNYQGLLMIEKPVFFKREKFDTASFRGVAVAYNLRFNPVILKLKQILHATSNIETVTVNVGSYLPTWRGNSDYRKSYSASKVKGGGVLHDLSHELDYILWLFGDWQSLTALGGKISHLEIDSDDAYSILLKTSLCKLVTIHLNYLERVPRREIIVNTKDDTIIANLVDSSININKKKEILETDYNFTYITEHQALINQDFRILCRYEEALKSLDLIEAVQKASKMSIWINNEKNLYDMCS